MSNVIFDPQQAAGAAAQGVTGLPVIVGLPSAVSPAPHFVIGVTTVEHARTSSQITGLPITDGDLVMKSARNSGSYSFQLIISETPAAKNDQVIRITKIVNQIANIANAIYGGGNILGTTLNSVQGFVASQITALQAMKDGFQPVFALNLFMPLQAFSINSRFLTSAWYIETLSYDKAESERGVVVDITLKELLSKQSLTNPAGVIENIANSLLGPGVGSAVGGLF